MQNPPPNPDVADIAPSDSEEHVITYLRLLDAEAEGADWRETADASLTTICRMKRAAFAPPALSWT